MRLLQEIIISKWLNVWLDAADESGSRVGGSTDFQLSLYLASEIERFHFASIFRWWQKKKKKKKKLGSQSNSKHNTSLKSQSQNHALLKEMTQALAQYNQLNGTKEFLQCANFPICGGLIKEFWFWFWWWKKKELTLNASETLWALWHVINK